MPSNTSEIPVALPRGVMLEVVDVDGNRLRINGVTWTKEVGRAGTLRVTINGRRRSKEAK